MFCWLKCDILLKGLALYEKAFEKSIHDDVSNAVPLEYIRVSAAAAACSR